VRSIRSIWRLIAAYGTRYSGAPTRTDEGAFRQGGSDPDRRPALPPEIEAAAQRLNRFGQGRADLPILHHNATESAFFGQGRTDFPILRQDRPVEVPFRQSPTDEDRKGEKSPVTAQVSSRARQAPTEAPDSDQTPTDDPAIRQARAEIADRGQSASSRTRIATDRTGFGRIDRVPTDRPDLDQGPTEDPTIGQIPTETDREGRKSPVIPRASDRLRQSGPDDPSFKQSGPETGDSRQGPRFAPTLYQRTLLDTQFPDPADKRRDDGRRDLFEFHLESFLAPKRNILPLPQIHLLEAGFRAAWIARDRMEDR
jgi:hypothetical protein